MRYLTILNLVLFFLLAPNAHALNFELSDGRQFVQLADLPPQPTLVNFWRYDCPPCLQELPLLAAWAKEHQVRLITIALHRPSANLNLPSAMLAALQTPVLALFAPSEPSGLLKRAGNPLGLLPFTLWLNPERQPCRQQLGMVTPAWLDSTTQQCNNTHSIR